MRVERTENLAAIERIALEPSVWEMTSDDANRRDIVIDPRLYYLLVKVDEPLHDAAGIVEIPAGLVAFYPENCITCVPHMGILPEYRGIGTEALKLGIDWMFANTPCRKLVARPPVFNKAIIRVFEKCGFSIEGRSPRSFLRHGVLHDRLCFGLERD